MTKEKGKYYVDDKWILDENGNPKQVFDLLEWARWFEEAGQKRVLARTEVGPYHVSTVFLGMDYSFSWPADQVTPVLWETMTFENKVSNHTPHNGGKSFPFHKEMEDEHINGFGRYRSKEEALADHEAIVKLLRAKYEKNDLEN